MKAKKQTLRSGQEIWTSGKSDMLPGKQTITVSGRKKHKQKKSSNVPTKVLLCLILVTVLCAFGAWYITKPQEAKPKIEKGDIYVTLNGSELTVQWPKITGADVIRLYRVRNGQEDILCGEYTGDSAILTGIAPGELVYLRIEAVKFSENMLGEAGENIAKTKTVRIIPAELEQPILKKKVDLDTQTVSLVWDAVMGNTYEIYQYDGDNGTEIIAQSESQSGSLPISFDGSSASQSKVDVTVRAIRKGDGYVCAGDWSQHVLVKPEDLMGLDSSLAWVQNDERIYTLHWQETKGDSCELQQWSDEEQSWVTLKYFSDWSEELTYVTDRLPSCKEMRFRILAYEGDRTTGRLAVAPSEITFWTDVSPLYCTIWPIQDLKLYADSEGTDTLEKVPAGKALCVLGEANGRFNVRYNGVYGYLDSNFCMINLPEYLGDLCEYDIANSYESIFRVHGNAIPEITGTVIPGFENVCLKNDEMLAPYLYPCAQRLETAVRTMREDGYTVRIYESYRPHKATTYLYTTTEKYLNNPVVGRVWTTLLNQSYNQSKYAKATYAKQLREDHLLDWTGPKTLAQFLAGLTEEERAIYEAGGYVEGMDNILAEQPMGKTYYEEMTNGTYSLGAFLAQSVSAHNRGIALDLTLVNMDTGADLFMQSDMHDLSWNSVLSKNNSNAKLLSDYMLGAGFNGLSSEWWHFQDDTTKNNIGLNAFLEEGVSIEGWKRDDTGWRYRLDDGDYYRSITIPVDGTSCTFNEEGYLQQ